MQLPAVKLPVVDMAKVPLELRAQVDSQMERLKQLPPSSSKASSVPSGVFRIIADYKCEVQVHSSLNYELCIAHPTSSFAIPAASLNAGTPRLLLEAKSPALTLGAQQVIMDLRVSQDMFALPPGVQILSSASGKS